MVTRAHQPPEPMPLPPQRPITIRLTLTLLIAVVVVAACGSGGEEAEPTTSTVGATTSSTAPRLPGAWSDTYSRTESWLCHPDSPEDLCTTSDLGATVVAPRDGALSTEAFTPADAPPVDCFYLYPTVDRAGTGTRELPDDPRSEMAWVRAEAARFSSVCRVFAPLYRQANGGSELDPAAPDTAYSDVRESFDHYLAQLGEGRPFALVGHGQGADLLTRLAQERIDPDAELRSRLLSAILVGGRLVRVPTGAKVGATFRNLPLCTDRDQTGCVIAYNSYDSNLPPDTGALWFQEMPEGTEAACSNPAGLDGSKGQLRAATFPRVTAADPGPTVAGLPNVEQPFVTYPEYFLAECVHYGGGLWYLWIDRTIDPLDVRSVGPLGNPALDAEGLGLHHLDVVLALGDLISIVEEQAGAVADRSTPPASTSP